MIFLSEVGSFTKHGRRSLVAVVLANQFALTLTTHNIFFCFIIVPINIMIAPLDCVPFYKESAALDGAISNL